LMGTEDPLPQGECVAPGDLLDAKRHAVRSGRSLRW
jgi:hypothetical protein